MYRTPATIAAALATLVVAAPLAGAQPLERGYVAPRHIAVAPSAITPSNSGFDWLDAAIGAVVATGALTLTGTGVLAARRPQEDATAAVGAD